MESYWQLVGMTLCGLYPSSLGPLQIVYVTINAINGVANLQWNINVKDLPWFSYGIWKRVFVDSVTKYIGPPNYVHYWMLKY